MSATAAIALFSRDCPLCGSTEKNQIFAPANVTAEEWSQFSFSSRKLPDRAHFGLVVCPTCDVLYADPIPSLEALHASYVKSSFDSGREARYASRTYAGLLKKFLKYLPDRSRALDVGTGEGSFLEQLLELHFQDVVGIEPSHAPIQEAKPHIRLHIREGLFRAADFAPESFRLITCFQTLEHLYDPKSVCRDFYRLLKPGGAVLFVLHNRRSLSAQLLGLRSPIYDVEHMQLFSKKSAAHLLRDCGFRSVHFNTVVNRYPLSYWLRLLPAPKKIKEFFIKKLDRSPLGSLPVSLPVGNFAVFSQK